jgi:hypothetical protein
MVFIFSSQIQILDWLPNLTVISVIKLLVFFMSHACHHSAPAQCFYTMPGHLSSFLGRGRHGPTSRKSLPQSITVNEK